MRQGAIERRNFARDPGATDPFPQADFPLLVAVRRHPDHFRTATVRAELTRICGVPEQYESGRITPVTGAVTRGNGDRFNRPLRGRRIPTLPL